MLLSLVICLFTVCINTVCIDNASTVSDIRTTRIKDHAIKDISIPSLNHLLFNLTDTMSTLAFTIPTILHHQKFIKQVQDTPVSRVKRGFLARSRSPAPFHFSFFSTDIFHSKSIVSDPRKGDSPKFLLTSAKNTDNRIKLLGSQESLM